MIAATVAVAFVAGVVWTGVAFALGIIAGLSVHHASTPITDDTLVRSGEQGRGGDQSHNDRSKP
jgi:hypothetical protein